MEAYVIEYKNTGGILSGITSAITGMRYTHTAFYCGSWFFELDAYKKPMYHSIEFGSIDNFLIANQDSKRTEAFLVSDQVTNAQLIKVKKWWQGREKKVYGFGQLVTFLWLAPAHKALRRWAKIHGRPYEPKLFTDDEVCSVAVDKCIKECLDIDLWPDMSERVTYPGLFAERLYNKHYIV